jgi:hypothetical protein
VPPGTAFEGFREDVIFPGGMLLEDDGEVKIYYGASDTVECLATRVPTFGNVITTLGCGRSPILLRTLAQ